MNDDTGYFVGVPFKDYLAWPGTSRSRLWTLYRRTPAHFRWEMDHPQEIETPAMVEGTAVHTALLEPDRFKRKYVAEPPPPDGADKWDRRLKAHKAAWADVLEGVGDRTLLPRGDWDYYVGLGEAVRAHPLAGPLLARMEREVSIQWRHPETGLLLKGRPDGVYVAEGGAIVVDLKSCRDASPQRFGADAYRFGYLFQVAMYAAGVRATAETEVEDVFIVAVEKEAPHPIACYRVAPHQLDLGHLQVLDALRQLSLCERYGDWPGYPEGIEDLQLPGYAGQEWTPFADGLEQVLVARAKRAGRTLPAEPEEEEEVLAL
ncbi:MAG TPA: PD-(D/E)XK nuclease-like domain-containing protein [Phycisphaerae bacterium]|nr:PD-(D/E)XK nuclease-like domain-containing protein [Phycisphaerae bacterium]HUX17235.1 PD-(D/E)XK nuclease-like domain-containing protein [Phycisphaerae bacterium]